MIDYCYTVLYCTVRRWGCGSASGRWAGRAELRTAPRVYGIPDGLGGGRGKVSDSDMDLRNQKFSKGDPSALAGSARVRTLAERVFLLSRATVALIPSDAYMNPICS